MLTRAGSLRCVRRNLIEADDNPHSELRYAKTTTWRLSRHRKPIGGAKPVAARSGLPGAAMPQGARSCRQLQKHPSQRRCG
jgi:hypothetical protein